MFAEIIYWTAGISNLSLTSLRWYKVLHQFLDLLRMSNFMSEAYIGILWWRCMTYRFARRWFIYNWCVCVKVYKSPIQYSYFLRWVWQSQRWSKPEFLFELTEVWDFYGEGLVIYLLLKEFNWCGLSNGGMNYGYAKIFYIFSFVYIRVRTWWKT